MQGKVSRKDLMKSVIAVSGEKHNWIDGLVPSTKADLLRRSLNVLNFSTGTVPSAVARLLC